jgi:hypothetical protein
LQVEVRVDKDSKEAKRAAEKQKAAAAAGGLDAFLTQIESKKKVSSVRQGAAAARLAAAWLHVLYSDKELLWCVLHETCTSAGCFCICAAAPTAAAAAR